MDKIELKSGISSRLDRQLDRPLYLQIDSPFYWQLSWQLYRQLGDDLKTSE